MEFSVLDRILITNLLPDKGNIVDLRIIQDLRDALGFSEEDVAEFAIVQDEAGVHWDPSRARDKAVAVGPRALAIIRDQLQALDRANKLTEAHIPLWDRFVEAEHEIRAVS